MNEEYQYQEDEDIGSEGAIVHIHLPEDDFDEDDEMDSRISTIERKRKHHISRGDGIHGVS